MVFRDQLVILVIQARQEQEEQMGRQVIRVKKELLAIGVL
jgi:hypothetical protein